MTLIACHECGEQVSTEAPTCPHCGVSSAGSTNAAATTPAKAPAPQSNGVIVGVLIGIGVIVLIFAFPSLMRSVGRSSLTGGKTDAVVQVNAPGDICWSGNIGSATQDGCGPMSIPVHDDLGLFSSNVQKKSSGTETISISVQIDDKIVASNSTSAAYGVAQVVVSP